MGNFCDTRPRLHRDSGSGAAIADYLAGYGEALADMACDRPQDRMAED